LSGGPGHSPPVLTQNGRRHGRARAHPRRRALPKRRTFSYALGCWSLERRKIHRMLSRPEYQPSPARGSIRPLPRPERGRPVLVDAPRCPVGTRLRSEAWDPSGYTGLLTAESVTGGTTDHSLASRGPADGGRHQQTDKLGSDCGQPRRRAPAPAYGRQVEGIIENRAALWKPPRGRVQGTAVGWSSGRVAGAYR
jgi:hypothetical protein